MKREEIASILVIGRSQSVVDTVISTLQANRLNAIGVTKDEDAIAHLQSGNIAAIVIGGGVEWASRRQLQKAAVSNGSLVIRGRLGNKDIGSYVQKELIPQLHQVRGTTDSLYR